MKITHKLNSFIGSLVIAFAIALFLPSAANATYGSYNNYSHNYNKSYYNKSYYNNYNKSYYNKSYYNNYNKSYYNNYNESYKRNNSTTQYNQYKAQAAKYLRAYYRCYNYTYYRYYVYYIKKAKACQTKPTPTNNCSKYKTLSDKYLNAYNRCKASCYYRYYVYYKNMYTKCQANTNTKTTGKVCGLVFEDTNGNTVQDAGEAAYAGAKVTITDVDGKTVTATTDAQGKYCQNGVKTGSTTIRVVLNSLPSGATITTEDPTTINVVAGKSNQAGKDGFEPQATVGKVCGSVFEDTNGNTVQDSGEPFYAGARVTITDTNGKSVTAITNAQGEYCKDGIEAGDATIRVDLNSLPSGATITTEDPTTIDVDAGQTNQAGKDGFEPQATVGKVCGSVFEDTNGNTVQDAGEPFYAGAKIIITDTNGNDVTVKTDAQGKYCKDGIEAGATIITIDLTSLPAGSTITTENPTTVIVEAGKANQAGKDGFKPAATIGRVIGSVFEDTNGNSVQDAGEPAYAGARVTITDTNGNSVTVITDAQGNYSQNAVEAGDATITVDLNSLPAGSTITTENPTPIVVEAGKTNQAGKDGFEPAATVGKVCGSVFEDTNGNSVQDAGEPFYAGARVTITDTNGNSVTAITDAQGKYCKDGIEAGAATITVDLNSLPAGSTITTENPTPIVVEAGKTNQAGKDGFEPAATIGRVIGSVFEDTNGNSVQDAGEPAYAGARVTITDTNGNSVTVITDAQGNYSQNAVEAGDATITVDLNSLPAGARITTENPTTIDVEAGKTNQAGKDGFEPQVVVTPTLTGSVCGIVFEDVNRDGVQQVGEPGIENITVTATDINGNLLTGTTDANGDYCISNVAAGNATVTVDANDADMPVGATDTTGTNPSPVNVLANTKNNAGKDGYFNPNRDDLGCVCFIIFDDKDNSGSYNGPDIGFRNVSVKITDANGVIHTVESDKTGTVKVILPLGQTTITVDDNDADLAGFTRSFGTQTVTMINEIGATSAQYHGFAGGTQVIP